MLCFCDKWYQLFRKFILLTVIVCCIALCVLLTFFCSKRDWSPLNCTNHNECIKILLVSDPQIIGEKNEKVHFLTPITVWHCDNYLKKSYRKVYNFVKPDVVIFLGDLMDEGSTATDAEFKRYRGRFFNIYPKSSSSKVISEHMSQRLKLLLNWNVLSIFFITKAYVYLVHAYC
jgi:hypothetical protein